MKKRTEEREDTPAQTERLQIRLFGGADIRVDGRPIPATRSRTEVALLALLVLRYHQEIDRSRLAGLFWPETREAQALNNLRRSLSNLRQALGDAATRLHAPTPRTVAFDLAGAFCDVHAFADALTGGDADSLRDAVALYRGPLLPDHDHEWLLPERDARQQAYLTALETLATRHAAPPEAIAHLRQILHVDPLRETAHRALMEALAAQGDRAGLTLAYRQLRQLLLDELRAEPSAQTKTLYLDLQKRLQNPPPASLPRTDGATAPPAPRIPWPLGELVGRETETQTVAALVRRHRLVTLTGSGGIGKTRLALAVAEQIVPYFADGVWFVDLSAATNGAQVLATVVRTLEMPAPTSQPPAEHLRRHLDGKQILLVLDNAEQVREACAALTAPLLESLPELRVLVTSRIALEVAGERLWRVPSLPVPDRQTVEASPTPETLLGYAGTRLFLTHAVAASSTFVLTERNAPAVARICARLDGVPLALELAAARVASLSPEQIAQRLENAFRLLAAAPDTSLPRHQTLRTATDWSYALMTDAQRGAFQQLSCFVGGWSLDAAEALLGDDAADHLASLIRHSMVTMETRPDGQTRYRLLETLRQYGQEKLREAGQRDEAHERHRRLFLRFAQENAPHADAPRSAALEPIQTEADNLRQALDACLPDHAAEGLEIAVALWRLWETQGQGTEGRALLDSLLSHPDTQNATKIRAEALYGAGALALQQGDSEAAYALQARSLHHYREAGDRRGEARALGSMGVSRLRQGDAAAAKDLMTCGLEQQRAIGDLPEMARSLTNLAVVARRHGDYPAAIAYLNESLTHRYMLDDREGVAHVLSNLGIVHFERADWSAARRCQEESLILHRALGKRYDIANNLSDLGLIAMEQGELADARRLHEESLILRREMGDRWGIALALGNLGAAALLQGDYPSARQYQQESLRLRRALNDREGIAFALANLGDLEQVEGNHAQAYALHQESLALFQEVGNHYGTAFLRVNLGEDCRALGRIDDARRHFTQCVALIQEIGSRRLMPDVLEGLARLALDENRPERAAVLYGAANGQRITLSYPYTTRDRANLDRALAMLHAQIGEGLVEAAMEQGARLPLPDMVALALAPPTVQ